MKLSDQEQVILKAIGHGVVEIAQVIKRVGYPKATVKKILIGLSNKGAVSLHRHDWPSSLTPAQRKLMVRIGNNYYGAVSVRERNPKGKHLRGATAAQQRQYEAILKEIRKSGRYKGREKEVAARTVKARAKNKSSKGKEALKTTGRALKKAASSVLGAGSQILGAGAKALNPKRKRNSARFNSAQWANEMARLRDIKPRPLHKLYGKSGGTLEQQATWKEAMSEWNRQYRHASKMQKIALEEDNAAFRARQAQNKSKKKGAKRNAATTVSTVKKTAKRRARASSAGRKAKKTPLRSMAKTRKGATRRVAVKKSSRVGKRRNALTRAKMPTWIKGAIRRARREGVDRAVAWETAHVTKAQRDAFDQYLVKIGHPSAYEAGTQEYRIKRFVRERIGKRNPSAESIRKNFAGSVNGERDLFFPQGTPAGKLAKLGKLVSITTERGTIKPVNGSAWLCADTKEKLHIGSTSPNPLFNGPKRSFGKVSKVEYEGSKPHLGYRGPIIWFHHMGEKGGTRPTLHADGKGGLKFRGGRYTLTTRGIEN